MRVVLCDAVGSMSEHCGHDKSRMIVSKHKLPWAGSMVDDFEFDLCMWQLCSRALFVGQAGPLNVAVEAQGECRGGRCLEEGLLGLCE